MGIKVILLDMDGTIWDSPVDWAEVRRAIGLPEDGVPIMDHLKRADAATRARGLATLEAFEHRGASEGVLMPGTRELMTFIRHRGLQAILVTNNSARSTQAVLAATGLRFDLVVTREDNPMKPSPEAFLTPLSQVGARPTEAVAIGDTHLDVAAAAAAELHHAFLVAPRAWARRWVPEGAGYTVVEDLHEARRALSALL